MGRVGAIAIVFAVAWTVGCKESGDDPGEPPLDVSFRKSLVPTRGLVMGIRNASDKATLIDVVIYVRSKQESKERSHVINSPIKPQDTITVGWVELDGWKLKAGDQVSIKCAGYAKAKEVEVVGP